MRKGFLLLIILTLICSMSVTSFAYTDKDYREEIALRYSHIHSLGVSFKISKSGVATCYGVADTTKNYDVEVKVELQQFKNRSWQTIKEWTGTGSGLVGASVNKQYNVQSGYNYRVVVTGRILDKKKELESEQIISDEVFY